MHVNVLKYYFSAGKASKFQRCTHLFFIDVVFLILSLASLAESTSNRVSIVPISELVAALKRLMHES